MAEHQRLLGQDQEGSGTACHVLCFQDSRGFLVQGEAQTEKEVTHGTYSLTMTRFHDLLDLIQHTASWPGICFQ